MKLAIMQPYIFPYIGYFQLIKAVDLFVIYDNIEYTKKGWINRNRILINSSDEFFTIPLKKDSDYLNVNERYLSDSWTKDRIKILNKLKENYKKAPFYLQTVKIIESTFFYEGDNLFDFLNNSLKEVMRYLEIRTEIIQSSKVLIDHNLKANEKVTAICNELEASIYINPIGGVELYSKEKFQEKGIKLNFLNPKHIIYKQFDNEFVPWLSMIDVLMFNSPEDINKMLDKYILI